MAASTALPRRAQRDVTRALAIALNVQHDSATRGEVDELVSILRNLDARTGRRDPSVRRRPAKRVTKKSARARR